MSSSNSADMPFCPLYVWMGSLAAGAGLSYFAKPLPFLPQSLLDFQVNVPSINKVIHGGVMIGLATAAVGVYFNNSAKGEFAKASTPLKPGEPITKLVTTGAFSLSRNPIYVASLLTQTGLAFGTNSAYFLLALLPFLGYVQFVAIPAEESVLERLFGDTYRAYKSRVPRWILF